MTSGEDSPNNDPEEDEGSMLITPSQLPCRLLSTTAHIKTIDELPKEGLWKHLYHTTWTQ